MLCEHGYTANFDCPICECPGCGRTCDACVCHVEPEIEPVNDLDGLKEKDFLL